MKTLHGTSKMMLRCRSFTQVPGSAMTMDKVEGVAVMEVERFSKLGTLKLQQGQSQKALEAYKNAYQSAQTLGNHGYMQRACAFNLGAMLISIGSFNDGLTYLNQAIPPEGRHDGRSNGDLYFNYGLAYEGLRNSSESKRYFGKALEEYRSEKNNLKMEADTISHIGKICLSAGQINEAESWMKQLVQVYDILGEHAKKLQAQVERANLLLKDDRAEEAEEMADDCMKGTRHFDSSENIANVLIELSLAYTQMTRYDKALEASEKALPLVSGLNADPKYETVLYQNLGAIHNNKQEFEEAIKYHEAAVKKHAELKNRKSQGHCFINMGYAYSQLKNMEKAEECFQHALLAARDCGDHKSEWQSLEALGSVVFHQKKLKRAQDYFKEALTTLAKSAHGVDGSVQERIMGKLTSIIQLQVQKPTAKPAPENVTQTLEKTVVEEVIVPEKVKELKAMSPAVPKLQASSETKAGSVIAVRRGTKIKFLRVRRSGTLRRFKKIALGLDPDFSTASSLEVVTPHALGLDEGLKKEDKEGTDEEEEEDLSAYTTEEEDESNEQVNSGKKHVRPADSFIPHHKAADGRAIESDLGADDEEDVEEIVESNEESGADDDYYEQKQMFAEMKRFAEDGDGMAMSQTVKTKVIADVHVNPEPHEDSEEESDEDSETDSMSSSSEGEAKRDNNKLGPPRVPSVSPQPTAVGSVRTYEVPAKDLHYETIDHKPPSGPQELTKRSNKAGERVALFGRPSDDDGNNYFHSDDDRQLIRQKRTPEIKVEGQTLKEGEEDGKSKGSGGGTLEGTIYESIRPQSRLGRNAPDEDQVENEDDSLENLPKGERDKIMFSAFQADQKKQGPEELTSGDQKSSKHCIVM